MSNHSATPSSPHSVPTTVEDLPHGVTHDDVHAATAPGYVTPVVCPLASTAMERQNVANTDAYLNTAELHQGTALNNPNVKRYTLPWAADIVVVSGAEEIKAFEQDQDVARAGDGKLPWWFFLLLRVSKFYCFVTKRWFVGMYSPNDEGILARRDYIQEKLRTPYSEEDVEACVKLLVEKVSDQELRAFCARFVGRYFLKEMIPDDVAMAAESEITVGLPTPTKYVRCARSSRIMYDFVHNKVPDENVEDVIHNIGAAAGGMGPAMRVTHEHAHEIFSPEDLFKAMSKTPIIDAVPRVAIGRGTVGGLLSTPLVPDQTFIVLKVGSAATATQSGNFLFGPGTEPRQCPFKPVLVRFALDVAQHIRAL